MVTTRQSQISQATYVKTQRKIVKFVKMGLRVADRFRMHLGVRGVREQRVRVVLMGIRGVVRKVGKVRGIVGQGEGE